LSINAGASVITPALPDWPFAVLLPDVPIILPPSLSESLPDQVRRLLGIIAPFAEAVDGGLLLRDRQGRILYANSEFQALVGAPLEELHGRTVLDFYDDEGRSRLNELMQSRPANERTRYEFYITNRLSGVSRPVLVTVGPVRFPGHDDELNIVTLIDLSEMKQMQEFGRQQAMTLERHAEFLKEELRLRESELYQTNLDSIYMLALASEARDPDTGNHIRRIQQLTRALALEMGVDPATAEIMATSSILHDVGKLGMPDEILKKPGPLTELEFRMMQQHTVEGERILGTGIFFGMARLIARSHHEAWDGRGYPDGLKGEAIPFEARIVSVVDTYDALVNKRVYKVAWTSEAAVSEIRGHSGKSFDPAVVAAFVRMWERGEVDAIYEAIAMNAVSDPSTSPGIQLAWRRISTPPEIGRSDVFGA